MSQNRLIEYDTHLLTIGLHHRFIFNLVADKAHSPLTRLTIVILLKSIGPHIPIQNKNLGFRIQI